jgi:adenine-specific DNA-methyltransferase
MELHRARCVLDEVFGAANYLATVVWQRTSAKSLARRTMGTLHESILVYGASEEAELRTLYLSMEDEYVARRFTQRDERGRYDTGDLTASSYRPHLDSGKSWRGFNPSTLKRCWAVPRAPLLEIGLTDEQLADMTMREKLDALDNAGYIHWPASGGFPRFKKYLRNVRGRAIGDLWTDINVINSQAAERSGFSTQKPEALIQRILEMGSDKGDIVLDCFLGSGTTAGVAHKMGRRWVGVEWSRETVETVALPRLTRVIGGEDSGGVTQSTGWQGGGGFRVLDVAPSMFYVIGGRVVLADWATGGALAEAVAARYVGAEGGSGWPW